MSKDDDQLPKVLLSEGRNTLMPHLHFADIMQNVPVSLILSLESPLDGKEIQPVHP